MNKTVMATASLLALASGAHAAGFDGAYAGAQLGYNTTNIKYTETSGPANVTIDGLSAKGADYGVFAGYGQVVGGGNVYLGAEAEYTGSNAKNEVTSNVLANSEMKKKSSYGAAARVGYVLDGKILPYVRVGYNRAKFEQEVETLGSGDDSKGGVALGAGLEVKTSDNVALRGEFVRTSYGKMSVTDGSDVTSYKPTESVARVGLSYRF